MNLDPDDKTNLNISWQEEYKILSDDIDFNGKLKFHRLCSYFFEIASLHANHLHFGFRDLEELDNYWVLSRLHVVIKEYPGFDQRIIIKTWPKGLNRLFALRDFLVYNQEQHIISMATSAWLILDKSTGRPIKPDHLADRLTFDTQRHAIEQLPGKISPLLNIKSEILRKVFYSDLDINRHLNAAIYITWIQDMFPLDFYSNHQIDSFQVNYLNETRYGETIHVVIEELQGNLAYAAEGRIENNGDPVFRAKINFKLIP